MIRVLHVISGISPENGGSTAALLGLAKGQAALGMDVAIAATWRYGTGHEHAVPFTRHGVKVRMVGPAWGPLSWHPSISKVLSEMMQEVDVVHVHGAFEEIQYRAGRVSHQLHRPYVFTPTNALTAAACSRRATKKKVYINLRLRRVLQQAACIHASTESERDGMAWLNLRPPIIVESNGIELEDFAKLPALGSFIKNFPSLQGKNIVLFLGRLSPEKGLELLLSAFAKTIASIDAANRPALVLAGPDAAGYQSKLESIIQSLSLQSHVVFTGMLSGAERCKALVDAEVTVLPSFTENFGLVVAESVAAGTPVIVTEGVGLSALVRKAGVGSVVRYDIDALAAELRLWLTDKSKRYFAQAAIDQFEIKRFSWEHIAARWQTHYDTIHRS
jgi:glycosyltransferase involved in cell wall biosynthesis